MLGITELSDLLVEKIVQSPRSKNVFHIALDVGGAQKQRDALVKHVYTMLFNFLVGRMNSKIDTSKRFHKFIGLLDVFGFEVFTFNTFEQLCINYANERLHQFFLLRVFEVELELYRMQALQVPTLTYPDNSKIIDLLDKSPTGIFCVLDGQCKMPKASDLTFCAAIQKTHKEHPSFMLLSKSHVKRTKEMTDDSTFVVRHYAGDVCYMMTGFLEKNADTLPPQACDAMRCDAMRCDAMLRYATLCYAMLRYATLCYAILRYATLCYAMLRDGMGCDAMRCDAMRCDAMPCYAMLCRCLELGHNRLGVAARHLTRPPRRRSGARRARVA
jgi:hypothetical protein